MDTFQKKKLAKTKMVRKKIFKFYGENAMKTQALGCSYLGLPPNCVFYKKKSLAYPRVNKVVRKCE